jgi:ubiquinone/menaquinone biosynthesis C-methylase UbiE
MTTAAELDAIRYSEENLSYWTSKLVAHGAIRRGHHVLDIGCGTGGFAIAIAERTGARLVGCDRAAPLVAYARERSGPVRWLVADAQRLPFADGSFDRALMSLLLHQVPDRQRAVAEGFRVLRRSGTLAVRTVAPEDVAGRVPFRFFPAIAAAKAAQMPEIDRIVEWLTAAGFERVARVRVVRSKRLRLAEEEQRFRREAGKRYPDLGHVELENGLRRMREDWERRRPAWTDPRPMWFVAGTKP